MSIQDKIRSCRRSLGYTQQSLADTIGVSKRCIAYYESGQREPRLIVIYKLSSVFKVPLSYLMLDSETDPGTLYYTEIDRRELGTDAYNRLYKVS